MPHHNPVNVVGAPMLLTITNWQLNWAGWTMTLLAYIVVLNLYEEFVEGVVIESFVISILVSVVLLILLVIIEGFEDRVHEFFAERSGTANRVIGAATMLAILVISKFAILEIINFIFGEAVELGHIVEVLILVLFLVLAQKLMVFVWQRLGEAGSEANEDIITE